MKDLEINTEEMNLQRSISQENSSSPSSMRRAATAFGRLHEYLQDREYKGYEFDDLLDSPFVRGLTFGNLFLQRVAIQVGRLSPINFRALIGVSKRESTKARGFCARGYLHRYLATNETAWLDQGLAQLQWLLDHPSQGYAGLSWGNSFDFASRGGFFPKGLPTVVWTATIGEALKMAYDITGDERYRQAVHAGAEFVEKCLARHEDANGVCIAYAPGLLNLIHNSNLFAAVTLLRSWQLGGKREYYDLARRSVEWTLSHIDGGKRFYYGVEAKHRWVDTFHTAYVIESLCECEEISKGELVPQGLIHTLLEYWIKMFAEDGTPWYYDNSLYPIDIQCCSQAIESASKLCGRMPELGPLADRVLRWTLDNMQKRNGAFRFRKLRYGKINYESIHWGEATMLSALGAYTHYRGNPEAPVS